MPALTRSTTALRYAIAPPPPHYSDWPKSVVSAWRANGALVPCGPGYRGIGWPESESVRLAALGEHLGQNFLAAYRTAAWVHGASHYPGEPHEFALRTGRRRPIVVSREIQVTELRLHENDTAEHGGYHVTTPFRTTLDLLYHPDRFEPFDRVACRLLAALYPDGLAAVESHLLTHRRPGRAIALARLGRMHTLGQQLSASQP